MMHAQLSVRNIFSLHGFVPGPQPVFLLDLNSLVVKNGLALQESQASSLTVLLCILGVLSQQSHGLGGECHLFPGPQRCHISSLAWSEASFICLPVTRPPHFSQWYQETHYLYDSSILSNSRERSYKFPLSIPKHAQPKTF